MVPLQEGQDSQCYDFVLPYEFIRIPEVAVGNYFLIKEFIIFKVFMGIPYFSSSNH